MRLWHGRGVLAEIGLTAATPRARQPPTQGGAQSQRRALRGLQHQLLWLPKQTARRRSKPSRRAGPPSSRLLA